MTPAVTSALRFSAGAAMLLAGGAIYAVVRPSGHSAALSLVAPTFIHVVATVLLIAAVLRPTRRAAGRLCITWVAINGLFEIGQHRAVSAELAGLIDSGCGAFAACERTGRFFLFGTFDVLDLAAAAAGGVCAWLLLCPATRHTGRYA